MVKTWTRREVIASAGLSAIGPGLPVAAIASAAARSDQIQGGKRLTLLHFTDTHAQLETHPEYLPGAKPEIQMMGGYARLKTAIEHERAHCEGACFLLDGGDEFQGSGPAAWSEGEAILEPLKVLGIDVFTPGNWEPAYGPERFKQTMSRLGSPVVCYNFHDTATGNRLFPASITLERQGVKIAVVGVTDIGASGRQPPAEFRGMDTTRIEGLRDFVKELRGRERPDLVVALTHTGLSIAREIARETPEFDVVLSGHTHERTAWPILEGNVIVVEPGCFGSFLGRVDLVIKPGGGVASHDFRLIPILASGYDENAHVKALVDKSSAEYRAPMTKQAGRTETVLMRYDLRNHGRRFHRRRGARNCESRHRLHQRLSLRGARSAGNHHRSRSVESAADGRTREARLGDWQRTQGLFGTRTGDGVCKNSVEAQRRMGTAGLRNDIRF
jgi:2',3'-cyclic-nucleotide 2'-phosphodiesterase (5'-nucleotidase family)